MLREGFVMMLKSHIHTRVAEVGVSHGSFLDYNIDCLDSHGVYYGIDPWKDYDQRQVKATQEEFDKQYIDLQRKAFNNDWPVVLIRETSKNSSTIFPDNYFDWVFIDADHRYESVKEDIDLWWCKVKKCGIFSGHDYTPDYPGVIAAVNEFAKARELKINLTDEPDFKSWYVIK